MRLGAWQRIRSTTLRGACRLWSEASASGNAISLERPDPVLNDSELSESGVSTRLVHSAGARNLDLWAQAGLLDLNPPRERFRGALTP